MKSLLTLRINGEAHELAIPHHWTLLEALRYEAGLTGSKQARSRPSRVWRRQRAPTRCSGLLTPVGRSSVASASRA